MSLQSKVLKLKLEAALAVKHAQGWQRLIDLYGEERATAFYTHLGLNHLGTTTRRVKCQGCDGERKTCARCRGFGYIEVESKSVEWEGLTLHREPTELEKRINLKAISDAFVQGEQQLVNQLLVLRDKLITDAGLGIIKLSPADYHTLVLDAPKQATEELKETLERIYAQGRKLVLDELRAQGATDLGDIGDAAEDDLEFLSNLGDVTVSRVANDVQSRAIGGAAGLVVLGLAGGALVSRLTDDLQAGSVSYINNAAAEADHAALGLGRDAEGSNRSDIVQEIYYSSLLDDAACENCVAVDGETGSIEEITPAPNPSCLGGARCRCIHVYVIQGEQ